MNSKRKASFFLSLSTSMSMTLAATSALTYAQPAHASLFGCDANCQVRKQQKAQDKALRQQQKAQEKAARQAAKNGYSNGYSNSYGYQQPPQQPAPQPYNNGASNGGVYGPTNTPSTNNGYGYQQPAQQPAAQAGYGYQQQQQVDQRYQQQYNQPTYQQPSSLSGFASYYDYNHTQTYGVLTNQDWLRFSEVPYGYQAPTAFGAAYDKNAYAPAIADAQIQGIIATALAKNQDIEIGASTVNVGLIRSFYSLRQNQPAFVTMQGLTPQAQVAHDLFVTKSVLKGLDARDYWSPDMEKRFSNPNMTPGERAALDVLMVQSYIRLAADLSNGRVDPKLVDTYIMIKRRPFTDYQALNNTLRPGVDQLAAFESFEPQHEDYKRLQQALPNLVAIQQRGGWPKISGLVVLKPGASSADVPLIRARLMELNILPYAGTVDQSPIYDPATVEAFKEFQFENKMKPDGIIGKQGYAVLNTTVQERIQQVRATLEKWRWMPRQLGARFILVNIARQEMQTFENGQLVMSMKTVNGQVLRPTNILFDQVVSVDMNPYWNPPPSLILKDLVPHQIENRNHLVENHVKIYSNDSFKNEIDPSTVDWKQYKNSLPPYVFREEPGLDNSLGVVKFQTTNSSAIYLHDTNHREFFEQYDERYLSSGCIRLQHPLDLLQYLLRSKPEWTPSAIDTVLSQPNKYTHNVVQLGKEAIPFYVFYGTASFDDQGHLRFARDAYSLDQRIVRAMTPADDSL